MSGHKGSSLPLRIRLLLSLGHAAKSDGGIKREEMQLGITLYLHLTLYIANYGKKIAYSQTAMYK